MMDGWCLSRVLTSLNKQVDSLVCFVEGKDVDFTLLRVMGLIAVLCGDYVIDYYSKHAIL